MAISIKHAFYDYKLLKIFSEIFNPRLLVIQAIKLLIKEQYPNDMKN